MLLKTTTFYFNMHPLPSGPAEITTIFKLAQLFLVCLDSGEYPACFQFNFLINIPSIFPVLNVGWESYSQLFLHAYLTGMQPRKGYVCLLSPLPFLSYFGFASSIRQGNPMEGFICILHERLYMLYQQKWAGFPISSQELNTKDFLKVKFDSL